MGKVVDFTEYKRESLIRKYQAIWEEQGAPAALDFIAEVTDAEELEYVVNEAIERRKQNGNQE